MLFSELLENDPLFRREVRERWRRPLTPLLLLIFSAALAYLTFTTYSSLVPTEAVAAGAGILGIGRRFFVALSGFQTFAALPLGVFLGAPTLAAERERGALLDWFLAGITPEQIVRAKGFSLASFVLVCSLVPLPALALCFLLGGVSPLEFLAFGAQSLGAGFFGLGVGLLISSQARGVSSALTGGFIASVCLLMTCLAVFALTGDNAPALRIVMSVVFSGGFLFFALAVATDTLRVLSRRLEELGESSVPKAPMSPLPAAPAPIVPEKTGEETPQISAISSGDFPPGSVNAWLQRWSTWNPVSKREVRGGLRRWESNAVQLGASESWMVLLGWLAACGLVGVSVTSACAGASDPQRAGGCWLFVIATLLSCHAAILGAHSFMRERQAKTLSGLALTPLLPLEIVVAKAFASWLLSAKWGAGIMAGALLPTLLLQPKWFALALCVALLIWSCGAVWGVALSFALRVETFASTGAFLGVGMLFGACPVFLGWPFRPPTWLREGWLEPIAALYSRSPEFPSWPIALLQVGIGTALFSLILLSLVAFSLRGQHGEEENGATNSILTRDLTKGLR